MIYYNLPVRVIIIIISIFGRKDQSINQFFGCFFVITVSADLIFRKHLKS